MNELQLRACTACAQIDAREGLAPSAWPSLSGRAHLLSVPRVNSLCVARTRSAAARRHLDADSALLQGRRHALGMKAQRMVMSSALTDGPAADGAQIEDCMHEVAMGSMFQIDWNPTNPLLD